MVRAQYPQGVVDVAPQEVDLQGKSSDAVQVREASSASLAKVAVESAGKSLSYHPGDPDLTAPGVKSGARVDVQPVEVFGQLAGAAFGVSLEHTDVKAAASWAELVVDVDSLDGAFGADYASRLELWAFPACAVQHPERPECVAGVELLSGIDEETGALVGVVPVDNANGSAFDSRRSVGGAGDGGLRSSDLVSELTGSSASLPAASSGGMIIAAVAGASGQGGTFTATDLRASGDWAVGDASGSFNYEVPLELPPASIGGTPSMSLKYSSAAVDGRNIADNGQASTLGEGWDLSTGYVERLYNSCGADDYDSYEGDLCWNSPYDSDKSKAAYVLSLGGVTYPLVWEGGERYRTQHDEGWRITRHLNGPGNADNTDEYFKLMMPDGSSYFFGLGTLPNGAGSTNSVGVVPVFGDDSGEPRCGSSASDYCVQGYRWMLDAEVDPNDNATTYFYSKENNKYSLGGSPSRSTSYTSALLLDEIRYGQDWSSMGDVEVLVAVDRYWRCVQATGTGYNGLDDTATCPSRTAANASSYPDVPLDLLCTGTCTSAQDSPVFFSAKRLNYLKAAVQDASGYWNWVIRHQLGFVFPDTVHGSASSLWLNTVQTRYFKFGNTAVRTDGYIYDFDGVQLNNRVDYSATAGVNELDKRRINRIYTPTGSRIDVGYITTHDPG